MADFFNEALDYVLVNEGGGAFTSAASDRGGATRWGITLKTLSEARGTTATEADVRSLGKDQAAAIYKDRYWRVMQCDKVVDRVLAICWMDAAVYVGTHAAALIMQRAVKVVADGVVGPKTVAAVNASAARETLCVFTEDLETYLCELVRQRPEQKKWLYGWLCRRSKMRAQMP